jgi:DNA-binding MarR family transcriptional regulator
MKPKAAKPAKRGEGVAFLISQVGAHAAARFAERMEKLGFTLQQVGLLRAMSAREGQSQQALAEHLGLVPSRVVSFVDDLEARGLVERRRNPTDRRLHALYLTPEGQAALGEIGAAAREHEAGLCAALNAEEREQLALLLRRIAEQQGLTPGVHPGFRIGKPEPRET